MKEILITGATGSVGGELVKVFARENKKALAATTQTATNFPVGIEARHFDFAVPETFAPALENVSRVFLLRPPAVSNVKRDVFPFLKFCRERGVEQIVFLSILGAENASYLPHRKIEVEIERLEIPHTFLRPSYFMQNFLTVHRDEIRDDNEIYVPAGSGETSFVDVRDVAEVAYRAFFDAAMLNRSYDLTGNRALNYDEAAQIFTRVLRRSIRYARPSALAFFWRNWRKSKNFTFALVMTAIYTTARFGKAKRVTDDVRRLLGREPISFEKFVADHAQVWEQKV